LKLPLSFRRGQRLKQVWELHPTHDGISRLSRALTNRQLAWKNTAAHRQRSEPYQGLAAQSEEGEQGYRCLGLATLRVKLVGHIVVHRLP
jgi:hypothetical protein